MVSEIEVQYARRKADEFDGRKTNSSWEGSGRQVSRLATFQTCDLWPLKPGNEHCRRPISITPLCLLFIFPGWICPLSKKKKKKEKERKKKGPRGKGWSGRVINADTLALLHLARENSRIAQRRGSLRASGTGFVVDHAVVTATDGSYFPSRDPRQISNERLVTGLELFEGRDI